MAEWYFKPKQPGDTQRESTYGEFFAADAISDPGRALVREGIQNSMDAGRDGEQVHVRIYLSGEVDAVRPQTAICYFGGLIPHLQARDNGLRPEDLPTFNAPCPFLAFEDFGTSGLEGDPAEPFQSKTGRRNHFYYFFRAEGQTDKGEAHRGSWGVGKHVFVRASRTSTVFGLTVRRSDHRRLLFGKCVLKCHWLKDEYCQDGYFGQRQDRTGLVLPLEDEAELARFCNAFQLQRGNDPGLSIVVPWPDPEITDRAIVTAVVRDYFYPILCGDLVVWVETPSVKTILDAGSLIPEVSKLDADIVRDVKPLVELAKWALDLPEDQRYELNMPPPDQAWQWSRDLIPREAFQAFRDTFQRGDPCPVRVPVTVRKKDGTSNSSHFDVFLKRDVSEQSGRPVFIRGGVIISRVDAPRSRGTRAIVIADDPPIASFLRDAENPSHTEWQQVRLKANYKSGVSDLGFVRRSVHELVRILTEAEKEEDRTLLADFFSLPAPPEENSAVSVRQKRPISKEKGTDSEKVKPPPRPRPQGFQIQKVQGGFSVLPSEEGVSPPRYLKIRVAYSTRRGNPLNKYDPADFRLEDGAIKVQTMGITLIERKDNKLLLEIHALEFKLEVTGFDTRRDLYVNVIPKEDFSGDTAA